MKQYRSTLVTSLLITWLGSAAVAGCGDDDDASDGTAGGKGGSGGTAGTGGAAGRGGSGGGGTGGTGTGGGTIQGGAGGSDGGVGGSDGGVGGGGGAGGSGDAISKLTSGIFKSASDLRGLNFSQDGSKLYASGHIGSDPTTTDRELVVARFSPDGVPDKSFGTNGFVTLNLVERETSLQAAPPVGNGGAGGSDDGGPSAGSSAGGADTSSGGVGAGGVGGVGGEGGSGGATEVVINDGNEQSLGIVELSNGDLIVQANLRDASGKGQDVALVKLDKSGALVTSFGKGGVRRVDLGWTNADAWTGTTGPTDDSWGIALDKSGATEKIVLFGHGPAKAGSTTGTPPVQRTDNDRYVARLLATTGALDPAFNGGAVYTVNTGGTFSDGGRRGIVLADGSIISSGYTNYGDGLGNHIVLIKLLPNGTPDASFGFGIPLPGIVRANPFIDDGGIAECYGVAQQASGRLVTTGYGRATAAGALSKYGFATTDAVDLVSAGILSAGLDTTFAQQGALAIQSEEANLGNTEDRGRDLTVLPDGRIVFVGRFGPNPAVMVTDPDGHLDTSFGESGILAYDPLSGAGTHFYRVALSPDGTRIAAATNNDADGALLTVLKVGD